MLLSELRQMCTPLSFLLTSEWKWHIAHMCTRAHINTRTDAHKVVQASVPSPRRAPEPDSLDMGDIRERGRGMKTEIQSVS